MMGSSDEGLSIAQRAAAERKQVTISRSSRPTRFYLWLYNASPSKINVCKLFWGFALAPLALLFAGIVTALAWVLSKTVVPPIAALIDRVGNANLERRRRLSAEYGVSLILLDDEIKRRRRKNRTEVKAARQQLKRRIISEASLEKASEIAARVSLTVGTILPYIGFVVAAGLLVAGVIFVPWQEVVDAVETAATWIGDNIKEIVLGIVALAALTFAIYLVLRGIIKFAELAAPNGSRARRVGKGIAKPFVIAAQGILAIKYRTCPTVKIES